MFGELSSLLFMISFMAKRISIRIVLLLTDFNWISFFTNVKVSMVQPTFSVGFCKLQNYFIKCSYIQFIQSHLYLIAFNLSNIGVHVTTTGSTVSVDFGWLNVDFELLFPLLVMVLLGFVGAPPLCWWWDGFWWAAALFRVCLGIFWIFSNVFSDKYLFSFCVGEIENVAVIVFFFIILVIIL